MKSVKEKSEGNKKGEGKKWLNLKVWEKWKAWGKKSKGTTLTINQVQTRFRLSLDQS